MVYFHSQPGLLLQTFTSAITTVDRDGLTTHDGLYFSRDFASATPTDGRKHTYTLFFRFGAPGAGASFIFSSVGVGSILLYISGYTAGDLTVQIAPDTGDPATISTARDLGESGYDIPTGFDFTDDERIYFVQLIIDTTQGTQNNRARMFVGEYGGVAAPVEITAANGQKLCQLDLNVTLTASNHYYSSYQGIPSYAPSGTFGDIHYIDGQALDYSYFVGAAGSLGPIEFSGSYGNMGYHLDFDNSGDLFNDESGNNMDFTSSLSDPSKGSLITGTPEGLMTGGGGLAAAFNGTTSQTLAASAQLSGNNAAWIGLSLASGKKIWSTEFWGSSDQGIVDASNPFLSLVVRAKNGSTFSSVSDGTQIGALGFLVDANGVTQEIDSTDRTNAYDHVMIATGVHNAIKAFAEVKFWEVQPGESLDSGDHVPGWL